jgi:phosphoserine phosphatase
MGKDLGINKEEMTAYTDSYLDLPLLKAVGHVIAVNPDNALRRLSKKQGWEILDEPSTSNCDADASKKE